MKNRLQFNRIPRLFETREQANEFLRNYVDPAMRPEFIPLVGEPIVARYKDDEGHKQLILAVGKSVASGNVEYHFIDTAFLKEGIDSATELAENAESVANQALDLASAATKDVANYLVILKNMIGESGVELEDGSYFDDDDPSNCGIYKPLENSNYLDEAKSFRDADKKLDDVLGQTNIALDNLSGATASFSAETSNLFKTIIAGAGLDNASGGSYAGHDETHIIKDAESLDGADVLLDAAVYAVSGAVIELSANTESAIEKVGTDVAGLSSATIDLSANTMGAINSLDAKIDELSANTMAVDEVLDNKIDGLSANTMAVDEVLDNKIDELSANTMAADEVLENEIEALANRKVLGVSAITVNVLENGDSKVSLIINEEDDKVLTQNALGLKANVSLVYSREDKKIYLKGKNDITISTIDATDFIKDGMLSAASVFTASEADHEQYPELVVGKTYIKLLFNVDGEEPGRANPVFISAEDLVDIYTVDPESHTFMEINDYLIKLNVDEENGLASYNYARNISAVTANIISATGLNMGEQGGYPGHDETHYIKNARSLDQADVLLDEAIWGNNQGLAELSATTESFSSATHTVIENILAGTGLNTLEPGEYPGHDETHYIKDATSLDNADVLLDEAIWETSGLVVDISNRVDELSAATREFSANTHNTIRELSGAVINLSSVTESFSAHTVEALSALSVSVDERIESGLTILSGVVENYVEGRLSGLNFDEIYEYIDSGDTALKEHIDEVEEVTAGALNDLNERVGTIETHFNGEYIPLTGYELASGLSEDELIIREEDTVNDAFGKIQKQILDNEETIAGGLNDLNDKITVLSGVVITLEDKTEINALSGVVANNVTNINNVSGSVKYLSGAVVINRNDINSLSASLIDDELIIAASLNDLNRRVVALSGNSVDFSNYYTKAEVDAKYYNTANTYNKTEVNNLLSSVTNVYSSSTSFSAVTSTSARTSFSAVTSTSAITSTSARTSFSAITATSARTSLSAVTSLSAQTALSAMTAKNLDLRYTTSNALTNLNFAEFLTIATINGNATLSIASTGLPTLPANGVAERHVIIENTGSSAALVTIADDSRVKITPNNANFNQFAIDAGGRGELNVLITYNGSAYTIYVITT